MKTGSLPKRIARTLLCALFLLTFTGCGPKSEMDFTAVLFRDILTLDPQAASRSSELQIIGEIFEGLCRVDENGEAVPGVASRWESSAGGRRFTFHLRKARWSDGEPVTAADFVFGIARALRPETAAVNVQDLFVIRNARAVYAGQAEESALGLTAENDRTLVVELESPYPDFPLLTAGAHYMPCRENFFDESAGHYGLSAAYLLTNGPFDFAGNYAWDTGYNERSVSLTASATYHGERTAEPATVKYLIDYDESYDSDPLAALTAGSVDVWPASRSLLLTAEERDIPSIAADNAVVGLLLNPQDEALHNVYLRQMFIQTIDRQELLARGADLGPEARGIVHSGTLWGGEPYYDEGEQAFAPQDPEITGGLDYLLDSMELERVPSITVLCPDDPTSTQVADGLLIAWNRTLGNAFNLLPLPQAELEYRVRAGDYQAALYTLAGGPTAFDALAAFGSESSPQLLNDPDYDAQLKGAAFDLSACKALEATLQAQYVFYPLFEGRTAYVLNPKAEGITVLPSGLVEFAGGKKRK